MHALGDGPVGRRTLVERTGFSESVVRTELGKLEARGDVRFAKAGTTLTEQARARYAGLIERVRAVGTVDLRSLALDVANRAAVVADAPDRLAAWQLRDLAVREGATGALLLRREGDDLVMPDLAERLGAKSPTEADAIEEAFPGLADGDHLVIVYAPDVARAAGGLWNILSEWVGTSPKG